jgi:hypothetical protein
MVRRIPSTHSLQKTTTESGSETLRTWEARWCGFGLADVQEPVRGPISHSGGPHRWNEHPGPSIGLPRGRHGGSGARPRWPPPYRGFRVPHGWRGIWDQSAQARRQPRSLTSGSQSARETMRRRDFIAGPGSAVAWPGLRSAQQDERVRPIGVLIGGDENDPRTKTGVCGLGLDRWP